MIIVSMIHGYIIRRHLRQTKRDDVDERKRVIVCSPQLSHCLPIVVVLIFFPATVVLFCNGMVKELSTMDGEMSEVVLSISAFLVVD